MKKFAFVSAIAALALATSASAVTLADFGNSTITVGSRGPAVVAVQTALNICQSSNLVQDGVFGPKTALSFKAFQTSKGLVADGKVGPMTKAMLAACSTPATTPVTPTPGTTDNNNSSNTSDSTLNGGAGDIVVTATSTDVESDVKEGDTENVIGIKVEADGSDVALTSVRFEVEKTAGTGSTRPNRYFESFKVMLAGKEVGSIDAADLTKDGNTYRANVTLDEAIVRDEDKENLHVAAESLSSVDDETAEFTIELIQVRFEDAEGVVTTENSSPLPVSETFGFDDVAVDDDIAIKSSSSNPDAATLKVDESDTSDEYLVLQYKLDVDDKSSDIVLNTLPILATFVDGTPGTVNAGSADMIIDEVRVEIGGEKYDADLESENGDYFVTNGSGTAVYTVDVDGDLTIDAGDVVDVKVYATFKDQDGNYDVGTTVSFDAQADLIGTAFDMDVEGEDTIVASTIGTASGDDMTLVLTGTEFSNYSWTETEGATTATVDFFVTIKADDEDFTFAKSSVLGTVTRNSTPDVIDGTVANATAATTTNGAFELTKVSGDATASGNDFIINEGDTARFRIRFVGVATVASTEATITSIGGQEVPDDKQLSPTAVVQ